VKPFAVGQEGADARWRWGTLLIVLGFAILILLTFQDYGITYDEDWHAKYGDYVLQWYSSGFRDTRALTFWTLPLQGAFFDATASLAARLSPLDPFATRHLITALFALLGVVAAAAIASRLGGAIAGFLAAAILVTTPRYYGHAFNNMGDIPMAALSLLALYYLVVLIHHRSEIPKNVVLKLGLVVGLALAVRIGAIALLAYVGVALIWSFSVQLMQSQGMGPGAVRRSAARKGIGFLSVAVFAYLAMLAWWPAAQVSPIAQPLKALRHATRFAYTMPVFFEGREILNTEVPWYYVAKSLLITLPEIYFIGLALGIVGAIAWTAGGEAWKDKLSDPRAASIAVLVLAASLPIAYTIVSRPAEYDGVRHYLFVISFLAVLSSLGLAWLVRRGAAWRRIVVMSVTLLLGLTALDLARLHPYQYVYFNRVFAGGLARASRSYETEYWGSSYREGAEWIVKNLPGEPRNGVRFKVASCLYPLSTSHFLPEDRFEYLGSYDDGPHPTQDPEIMLATRRFGCLEKARGDTVHTVDRSGTTLLWVIRVREPALPADPSATTPPTTAG
jgi:hypothetical protein